MKKYFFLLFLYVAGIDLFGQNIPVTVQGKPLSQVVEKTTLTDDDVILIAENNFWRKAKSKNARKYYAPYIAQNSIAYLPTLTGNTINLNVIFTSSIDGKRYYIDPNGSSVEIGGGAGKTYLAGNGINISNGNVINADDNSNINELQTLSLVNSQLSISNGNSVNLPVPVVDNFVTADLLATENRYHNFDGHNLEFGYLGQYDVNANSHVLNVNGKTTFAGDSLIAQNNFIQIGNNIPSPNLIDVRGEQITIGSTTPLSGQDGVKIGVTNPTQSLIFKDGWETTLGNPTGKYLRCYSSDGRVRWEDVPTPQNGISAVTASEGLTSSILNGNPNIQLGGNPFAVGVTNERGLNMGDNGSLVLRDIRNGINPVRDVIVITNDNNAIIGGDGEQIGIKLDVKDNITRISSSDESTAIISNLPISIANTSANGGGASLSLNDNALEITTQNLGGISNSLLLTNNNLSVASYNSSRNDPGTPSSIASFGVNGQLERHPLSELGIQPTLTAGTGISIVNNVISNTSLNTDNQQLSISGSNLTISNGNTIDIQQPPSNPYKYSTYFDDFYGFRENVLSGNIGQLDWRVTTAGGGVVGNTNFTSTTPFLFDNNVGYLEMKSGTGASGFSRLEMPLAQYRNSPNSGVGDKFRCRIIIDNPSINLSLTDVLIGYKVADGFGGFWGFWVTNGTLNAPNLNGSAAMQSSTLLGGTLFPLGQNNSVYDIEIFTEVTVTNTKALCFVNGVKRGELFCGSIPAAFPIIEFKSVSGNTDPNKRIMLDYFNLNLSNPVVR